MRSFSNLWYWIALAVVWSTTSHWVLGVPFDMVQRAARHGGEAERDLEDMVRINVNRLLYIAGVSGLWLLGIVSAFVTSLAILGFWYGVEFAQAVFLLAAPMTIVGVISLASAGLWLLGIVSAFVTSLAILGFWYGVEFAQAVFLLAAPMTIVGVISLASAHAIRNRGLTGETLRKRMLRHRVQTQFVGMIAIFITALWGMWQNMQIGALGG